LVDEFIYKITDANGINPGTDPAPSAVVQLTVQGLNDRPEAVDDSASVSAGGTITIDVVENDTDIDGDPIATSILVTQQPTNGSVRVAENGDLIYTAQSGFSGGDVLRYTVADNLGQQSEEATVTITVGTLPSANPDIGGAFAGDGEFDVDVLSNDTGDLDLSSLQIEMQPNNGTVAILADGTLRYTPTTAFAGEDTFSYSIADSAGRRSLPGEVTVRYVASGRQNPVMFSDVNASGDVTPDDALRVINKLAEDGRDANGIVLRDGIPIADADRGPDFWDADGSQAVTPNDILFVLNQLAENAVNDRGGELIEPSGELIQSEMIEVGTDLNRNGDRFEPVVSVGEATDKVVGESVLEATLDIDLIDLIVEDEATTEEEVATIDDVLSSLF
jgi:hypothetical protein